MLLSGLAVFGVASLGAATAPNFEALLVFRVLQAISGAMVLPAGWAVMREVVPAERRAYTFGLMGSMIGLAAAAGPPIGGLLTEAAGWRGIFYVNVPVVAAALALGWRALPKTRPRFAGSRFDFARALLLPAVLSALAGGFRAIASRAPWLAGGGPALALAAGAIAPGAPRSAGRGPRAWGWEAGGCGKLGGGRAEGGAAWGARGCAGGCWRDWRGC